MNAAVRHLPAAMAWLAPELLEPLPDEALADCASCPMAGAPFLIDVRCCTFHPVLPNFLAGRALRRGGPGADQVRARLQNPDGLDLRGIGAPSGWREAYEKDRDEAFGRRASWRCPYWVEGPLSCSVWQDRNSTCRSWHCKHVDGVHGQRVWSALRALGRGVESALARHVAACDPEPSDAESWEAHYLRCTARVEQLDIDALHALRTEHLDALRGALSAARDRLHVPVPDVLVPNVRSVEPEGSLVRLVGYSDWQPGVFPMAVFGLLGRCDGHTSWADAVASAVGAGEPVQASWVRQLFDLDLLRVPE